jgi:hypothetical protein
MANVTFDVTPRMARVRNQFRHIILDNMKGFNKSTQNELVSLSRDYMGHVRCHMSAYTSMLEYLQPVLAKSILLTTIKNDVEQFVTHFIMAEITEVDHPFDAIDQTRIETYLSNMTREVVETFYSMHEDEGEEDGGTLSAMLDTLSLCETTSKLFKNIAE